MTIVICISLNILNFFCHNIMYFVKFCDIFILRKYYKLLVGLIMFLVPKLFVKFPCSL